MNKLADNPIAVDYCMRHGYDMTYNRWLDVVIFTADDGRELVPREGVTASDLLAAFKADGEDGLSGLLVPHENPADAVL